ncbi:dienelactone hydrolase family protein [Sphingopyxis sp. JAI128]|uniref:alpha/beta hydrolase n=1 Tax=Sphingopyxis sp. JAI128 TaxID=2723066 RepID=UPI00184EE1F6|nr:dienelactone hydrolase family protein [Sphingopyxis sp. JAI128]MBB6425336.1 phospholipase/carboxylesterase [Sphingopyxis sp. JAI128]
MSRIVNGASLQPRSGAAPKNIVLLLHGFGSSGSDMISLAPPWQDALPDTLFLAPHAPQRCSMMGTGYQWWGLSGFAPSALAAGAAAAAPAIDAFIDRKLAQYDLSEADLALVGFSQGTMMALQIGLRRPRPVAAIVGYSGMLAGAADLGHRVSTPPPVLLVHGTADPVVPIAALHLSESQLTRLGVEVKTHISYGVGHSVDPVGLRAGRDFVADAFARS